MHVAWAGREMMGRPAYGGGPTCEDCNSLDIRRWYREGCLTAGQRFLVSWTRAGEPSGIIIVRTEPDAVVLMFSSRSREDSAWEPVRQLVPIVWTRCHLGGRRPWFLCTAVAGGRSCGRRAKKLYLAERPIFACRHCCGLAYASQQESPRTRGISQAQKMRERLGGSANLMEPFPDKPKGMHWSTYEGLRARAEAAENSSNALLMEWIRRRYHS